MKVSLKNQFFMQAQDRLCIFLYYIFTIQTNDSVILNWLLQDNCIRYHLNFDFLKSSIYIILPWNIHVLKFYLADRSFDFWYRIIKPETKYSSSKWICFEPNEMVYCVLNKKVKFQFIFNNEHICHHYLKSRLNTAYYKPESCHLDESGRPAAHSS